MPNFRLPKFFGGAGTPFDRDKFLDGKYQTYFAPGQKPDVVTLPGAPFASVYYPPTDWRPAGGILTPPQVAWLSLAQVDPDQQQYNTNSPSFAVLQWITFGSLEETYPLIYKWSDGFQVTITSQSQVDSAIANGAPPSWGGRVIVNTGPPSGSSQSGVGGSISPSFLITTNNLTYTTNPCYADYLSLLPAFKSAAARVNKLRKGKTWARVFDWTTANPKYQTWITRGFTGPQGPTSMLPQPWRSDIVAPPRKASPFFGVDFLHVHTGAWTVVGFPPSINEFEPISNAAFTPRFLKHGEASVKSSYSSFFRFSTYMYGCPQLTLKWGPYSPVGSTSQPPGISELPSFLPAGLLPPGTTTANFLTFAQFVPLFNTAKAAELAANVASTPGWKSTIINNQKQLASDLATFGYRYKGQESKLFDPDAVVALIAKRFSFNPDDGTDLPLQ